MAQRVLGQWERLLAEEAFVKVMPHDYKRVLAERAQRALAGQAAAHAGGNGGAPAPVLGSAQPSPGESEQEHA